MNILGIKKPEEIKSKSKLGQCKNADCKKPRRHGSAYCVSCSNKFKAQK